MLNLRTDSRYDEMMPRFVVLHHETPAGYSRGSHFDLMLEQAGSLKTWALETWPPIDEAVTERLPDHRPAYLDYEGDVAPDRGRVSRVEAGDYEVVADSPGGLTIRVRGLTTQGLLTLTPLFDDSHCWRVSLAAG